MRHKAWILTSVSVGDAAAFAEYRSAVAAVNAKLGGEMLIRGTVADILAGEGDRGEVIVALGFADQDEARRYIASPEYAALEPLRQQAGVFTIRLVA